MSTRTVFALALVLGAGCMKRNPEYCLGHPDDHVNCPAPDSPPGCTTDDQCPGQVCDVPSGTCVQCTVSSAAACTAATPVCDADDHTCRACTAHSECASDACLPDGTCATEDHVAYVTTNGDGTDCTLAAPCAKVADALATQRPYVKVTGTLTEAVSIDNQDVTVLAAPGAKLTPLSQGSLLTLAGTSNVSVYDLDIDGAHATGANPVVYILAGATGTVAFTRVHVDNGGAGGILSSASGGALTVTQSTVSGNTGGGIAASGGALTVTQSTVSGNTGGGISVTNGATFDITNNFIFRNGNNTTAAFGGVDIGVTSAGASRVEFNTIVDNQATSGSLNAGGVRCSATSFAAPNNIVARNLIGASTTDTNAQTLGDCTYPTSTVASTLTGLAFAHADATPFDYRLTSGSSAVDQATTPSDVATDVDGEVRPQGAQKDQGADEYTP